MITRNVTCIRKHKKTGKKKTVMLTDLMSVYHYTARLHFNLHFTILFFNLLYRQKIIEHANRLVFCSMEF